MQSWTWTWKCILNFNFCPSPKVAGPRWLGLTRAERQSRKQWLGDSTIPPPPQSPRFESPRVTGVGCHGSGVPLHRNPGGQLDPHHGTRRPHPPQHREKEEFPSRGEGTFFSEIGFPGIWEACWEVGPHPSQWVRPTPQPTQGVPPTPGERRSGRSTPFWGVNRGLDQFGLEIPLGPTPRIVSSAGTQFPSTNVQGWR